MKSNCCGAEPCDGPFECVGCEKCNRQVPPLTPAELAALPALLPCQEAMIRWPEDTPGPINPGPYLRSVVTYALQDLRNKKQ